VSPFEPGERIEVRELWDGRPWEVRRAIVVHDDADLIALYTEPASPALVAGAPEGTGERLRLPPPDWALRPAVTMDKPLLALHVPGTAHSVLLIWHPDWRLHSWYINLESGLERTRAGFDYIDHFLDVVVEPDMSAWRWKDEDELAEALERGLVSRAQAEAFRAEGERAVAHLLARRPPYDERWEEWRPEEGWQAAGGQRLP
jgi:hypothetical protein